MRDGDRSVDGLVACVCRVCGRRFHRRADHMSVSVSNSSSTKAAGKLVHALRTRADYVLAMGELCDEHLPDPPRSVIIDSLREAERRDADIGAYRKMRGLEPVPLHRPTRRSIRDELPVSTMETRRYGDGDRIAPDVRPAAERQGHLWKASIQDARDPLRLCRGIDPEEVEGGRGVVRGEVLDGAPRPGGVLPAGSGEGVGRGSGRDLVGAVHPGWVPEELGSVRGPDGDGAPIHPDPLGHPGGRVGAAGLRSEGVL